VRQQSAETTARHLPQKALQRFAELCHEQVASVIQVDAKRTSFRVWRSTYSIWIYSVLETVGAGFAVKDPLLLNRLLNASSLSPLEADSLPFSGSAEPERVKWMLGNECLLPEPISSRSTVKGSGSDPRERESGTDVSPSVAVSRSDSDDTAVESGSDVSTQVV